MAEESYEVPRARSGEGRGGFGMLLVHTENLKAGMEIGEAVHGAAGQMLLAPGVKLSERYIGLLRELNIPATYVADSDTSDVEVPRPIRPQTRASLRSALSESFDLLAPSAKTLVEELPTAGKANRTSERFEKTVRSILGCDGFDSLVRSVENVISDVQTQRVLVGINSIKTHDAYTFQHSIDVTVMGLVLAKKAGWDATRIRLFGIGCVLHDLGKVLIPGEILHKPGRLTEAEFDQMKQHPEMGYHLVKAIAPRLGGLVPQVAYQHHERQDGSGYPRALKGNNTLGESTVGMIHDFGALSAVADVYDAMASNRPYRKAWAPDQVVQTVIGLAGDHLNRQAVDVFKSVVAPYPVCSEVTVLTGSHAGHRGIVVKVQPEKLGRPLIRILKGVDGNRINPFEIDLAREEDVTIRSSTVHDDLPPESMGSRRKVSRPIAPLPDEVVTALREVRKAS